ncbi:MAG: excinuclease ABC subunit UvrC [Clostridiales bacterium]|nr:excinuclease ABC subunit UvrC [Clostridiales bacterium]
MFDIREELKKLPDKPGVYIMKDKDENIIYVGKAKILKNRVRQYFQESSNHSPKVISMVKHIKSFEYIVTDTEVEALILENNLIKKYSPKYNIMLKDDKTYPYIKLTVNEMFPRLYMTRRHDKDKAKYFGPYTSSSAIKETIDIILKIWPLRRCLKKFPRDFGKERPCLNYHIGQCLAPCANAGLKEDYDKMIEGVMDFLNGKHTEIIKSLEKQMSEASENLEFEKAAELRDKLLSVKKLRERQIIENMSMEDRDVISFARADDEALVQVFFIRGGKMTGREHFLINNAGGISRSEFMTDFVKRFYGGTSFIPKELVLQEKLYDEDEILKWLSFIKGQKVVAVYPQKGEKFRLVELAAKNAIITLEQFGEEMQREKRRTFGALEEIKNALEIDFDLDRIESYDISNTQGVDSVGSMVVFEYGKPKKSDYRKFKIKTVFGADDYASMNEVISRRFLRYIKENDENDDSYKRGQFNKLPDMIFLDGGKGQINAVNEALSKLNIDVPVCGMIKDDRHRTRGLIYNNKEILFDNHSEGFKLVTRIQDEVHRFAIEYHRKLHQKNQIKSILDDIKGIGKNRKKALIKHFGSIDNIRKASLEEIKAVESMTEASAKAVFDFFGKR